MGHKNKKSLTRQIEERYKSMLAIGQSKHEDKQFEKKLRNIQAKKLGKVEDIHPITKNKIYSYSTLKNYLKHANYFAEYCRIKHNCKTLKQCEPYINEWLVTRMNLSPYTIKLEAAALGKLYNRSTTDFIKTPDRKRKNIKRSRFETKSDKHFSEKNNYELIEFCKSTGLRRSELEALRGTDLCVINNKYYIHIKNGSKGGKPRYVQIIHNIDLVVNMMQAAKENKVFNKIHTKADIHGYRAQYCEELYKTLARPLNTLKPNEKFTCRIDKKGIVYDRAAMLEASKNLGHERINIMAEHYLNFKH